MPGAPANAYPAQVLNLSIAGERYNGTCDVPYQSAINDALTRNAVIVVAAGNESAYSYQYTPGNCAGVISVAATGRNGQRTKYTNYDNYQPQWTRIAIAAPGGSGSVTRPTVPLDYVFSTLNSGPVTPDPSGYTYGGMNGTSMAAPHVAGIVSLMLSVAPTKTAAQILSAIQTTARPFPKVLWELNCTSDLAKVNMDPKYCGAGIIDADAAIAALGPASPTTTTLTSSLGLSAFGQNVTFTATVTGNSPTGTVTFSADAATIPGCGAVPLAARIAQCSTPNLAVGVHTIDAAYAGDATHAPSSATPIAHTVTAAIAPKQRDFNADSKSDLLWRANVGGAHAIWLMNGTVAMTSAAIGLAAPWQVTHVADFNADYRHDLLVRDTVAGTTSIWLMNGIVSTSAATLLADPNWTATHTGDFNGDGNADIVWRHAPTGTTSLWLMNGTAMATGATLLVSTAWQVVQVADFDGDGKADLLWRNASTGESAIWLMNGGLFVSGSVVLASTAWSPILTGDFDGNGKADIVWRNASTGEAALWLMNGLSMASGAIVLANTNWEPTHIADFDGNGKADIVWRNLSTGDTSVWLMNGLAMASGGSITNSGSTVVTTGDYDGNGKADIVWHNSATGATEMRLMNGLAVSSSAVLLMSTDWNVRP